MLMRRTLLLACSLFLVASGCGSQYREISTETTETSTPPAPSDAESEIIAAARDYLEAPEGDGTEIAIVAVQGDYAQVLATPPADEADPATIFLRKTDRGWEGLALGTGFSSEDLDSLGIPSAVREGYE